MLYNGQEVGEPAAGREGFGGDDARTSIFDYWSMPEFVKWVNGYHDGGRLSQTKGTPSFYSRLVNLVGEPASRTENFFFLTPPTATIPDSDVFLTSKPAVTGCMLSFVTIDRRNNDFLFSRISIRRLFYKMFACFYPRVRCISSI